MAARKEIPRELSIYINDRQVINSLGGVTREITKVNAEMRNLNKNSKTYDQDLQQLQKDLSGLKDKQAAFKDEIHATAEISGEAREALSKMFLGLTTGNLKLAKEGLDGIKGSVAGLIKTSVAFIATPIGAAIALFAGIALATKEWVVFNESIRESNKLLDNLGLDKKVRPQIQGLAKVFKVEFSEIAKAVDNLVDLKLVKDEFQALEQIKIGLVKAPDKNEFLSNLDNNAIAAKNLGLNLKDVISLNQAFEDSGADASATFSALQKSSNTLILQSEGLKDSLSNALGTGFTKELLDQVRSGSVTYYEALDRIYKQGEKVNISTAQQAEIAKQLFGKSAIAAGGYEMILSNVNAGLENQEKPLSNLQQKTLDLVNANQELAEAQDRALKSDAYEGISASLNLFWIYTKTKFYDLIAVFQTFFIKSQEYLFGYLGTVFQIPNAITVVFYSVKKSLVDFLSNFGNAFSALGNLVTGNFKEAKKAATEFLKGTNLVEDLKTSVANGMTIIKAGYEQGKKVLTDYYKTSGDAANELSEIEKAKAEANKKTAEEQKKINEQQKKALAEKLKSEKEAAKQQELADKERLERAAGLAKALERVAKAELAYFIENNRSKIDGTKQLTQELLNEEINRLEAINSAKESALAADRLKQIENVTSEFENKKISLEEFNALKKAIDLEYLTEEQRLSLEFLQTTDALKEEYRLQQAQIKAEQLAIDNELALEMETNEFDRKNLLLDQQFQTDRDKHLKLLESKKITLAQYNEWELKATKDLEDQKTQYRLQAVASSLGALNTLAGALGELFGQSQELAIVQANISGAQSVLSIWSAPASMPQPYDAILKGVLTIAVVAQTAAKIKEIKSQKKPKTPRFFYGGFNNSDGSGGDTGTTAHLGYDEYGKVTGVTHDEEWIAPKVMTKSPKYAATFSWLENERKGIMNKGYFAGGETTSGTVAPIVNTTNDTSQMLLMAINRLNMNLEKPIRSTTVIGYQEAENIEKLNTERNQSNQNGIINEP